MKSTSHFLLQFLNSLVGQIRFQKPSLVRCLFTLSVESSIIRTDSNIAALQIRAGQRSITANLRSLTAHTYHVMIIVTIVTRNNIVSELARGYCLCYCKTFSLVLDSTECTKNFVTEKCSTLSPKIK